MGNFFGDLADIAGTAFNLPEWGVSEFLSGGQKTANTGRVAYAPNIGQAVTKPAYDKATATPVSSATPQIVDSGSGGGGTGYSGGAVAAAAAKAKAALQLNVNNAKAGSQQAAKDTANKYRSDTQSYIDSTTGKQNQINSDRASNELNRVRSIAAIVNAVRNGLKSGGVTLAGMNAADSSASDALARAYAKEGNTQTNDANNSAQLKENDLMTQQGALDQSRRDTEGGFDRFRDAEIGRIRGDLSSKLTGYNEEAGGGVDLGIVDQVIAEAISQLAAVDQMRGQRLAGVGAKSADQIAADAQAMNTAGVGTTPQFSAGGGDGTIDLTTDNPAETTTTNPIAIKRKNDALAIA